MLPRPLLDRQSHIQPPSHRPRVAVVAGPVNEKSAAAKYWYGAGRCTRKAASGDACGACTRKAAKPHEQCACASWSVVRARRCNHFSRRPLRRFLYHGKRAAAARCDAAARACAAVVAVRELAPTRRRCVPRDRRRHARRPVPTDRREYDATELAGASQPVRVMPAGPVARGPATYGRTVDARPRGTSRRCSSRSAKWRSTGPKDGRDGPSTDLVAGLPRPVRATPKGPPTTTRGTSSRGRPTVAVGPRDRSG